jgi:hypothetical protein
MTLYAAEYAFDLAVSAFPEKDYSAALTLKLLRFAEYDLHQRTCRVDNAESRLRHAPRYRAKRHAR